MSIAVHFFHGSWYGYELIVVDLVVILPIPNPKVSKEYDTVIFHNPYQDTKFHELLLTVDPGLKDWLVWDIA